MKNPQFSTDFDIIQELYVVKKNFLDEKILLIKKLPMSISDSPEVKFLVLVNFWAF